jgi:hypothetical protein
VDGQSKALFHLIDRVGTAADLTLPKQYELHGDLRCLYHRGLSSPGNPVWVYTYRITIEKQIREGGVDRWLPLSEWTSFGVTDGSNVWTEELERSTRKVIDEYRH